MYSYCTYAVQIYNIKTGLSRAKVNFLIDNK